jgi:Methyltransferase domain
MLGAEVGSARPRCELTALYVRLLVVAASMSLIVKIRMAALAPNTAPMPSLPFSSGAFHVAWSQQVAMNIADRATLYGETFRVLRAGGHFAMG